MNAAEDDDAAPRLAAHTTDDPDYFFQSDRDLKARRRREASVNYTKGRALQLKGKVLALALDGDALLVSTAAATAVRVNLRATYGGAGEHKGPVTTVARAGARQLVTGSWDKTAILWDSETKRPVRRFVGHQDFLKRVAVDSDAPTLLVTSSSDATIRVWDLREARSVAVLKGHRRGVEALAVVPESAGAGVTVSVVSGSSDGALRAWDVRGSAFDVRQLGEHLTTVYDVALDSSDAATVWSASADKTVQQRDLLTGVVTCTLEHPDWATALALTPDGHLATGCNDHLVRVWDPEDANVMHTFEGHFDNISSLVVWGSTLISGSIDATLRFWRLKGDGAADELPAAPVAKVPVLSADEEAELAALLDD